MDNNENFCFINFQISTYSITLNLENCILFFKINLIYRYRPILIKNQK